MRRARLAAALLGVTVVVTGFGGDDADGRRLLRAGERTLDARSLTFRAQFSIDGIGAGLDNDLEAHADLESKSGDVVSRIEGDELRAIVDGDTFWVTSTEPEFVQALPRGARWVRATFEELGDSDVIVPLKPPALLYLLAGATDVTAGRDGRAATFTFDLDLEEAIEEAPRARRQEVRELIWASEAEISAHGEAVVDGRYVRSLVVEGTVDTDDESLGEIEVRWDATFDDIGDEVTVEPPDPEQVVDLADVPELQEEFFGVG
jgi:hypothetical protein